jgi:hypothetical protein
MRLSNINQGLKTMNRVLTDTPRVLTPKVLRWETLGTCHNLHMGYKYQSIEYSHFLSFLVFFHMYKIGNWTSTGVKHCVAYIQRGGGGGGGCPQVPLMPPTKSHFASPQEKSFFLNLYKQTSEKQCRSKLDNWGAHIHILVFTYHKNNRFQKILITQNTNI